MLLDLHACAHVCVRASGVGRWENTDGLFDTCVSASGCRDIKRHVSDGGGGGETLDASQWQVEKQAAPHTPSRSSEEGTRCLFPSGVSVRHT